MPHPSTVGFSGTQKGMTQQQKHGVLAHLNQLPHFTDAYHGDCIGADAEFHHIVRMLYRPIRIHIFPPIDPIKRAFCQGDFLYPREPYILRNRRIVRTCDLLIATPSTVEEQQRSGTWATIRHARHLNRSIIIITPSGQEIM